MLDDTGDSLSALLNISLDDVKSVCHLRGICNKSTRKFTKGGARASDGQERH